ncbi:11327_t:CDS:2, partial [Ambispora gerdemannii]
MLQGKDIKIYQIVDKKVNSGYIEFFLHYSSGEHVGISTSKLDKFYLSSLTKVVNDINIVARVIKSTTVHSQQKTTFDDFYFETKSIYLNQQLAGVLDCLKYKDLRYIFISTSVDSSKLEIKGGSYWGGKYETEIIPCQPAQTYLQQNYPQDGTCQIRDESVYTRAEITKLYINQKGLEGELDLSDFPNLEILNCSYNCLTKLNVNNCKKLKSIYCFNNQLTTLNLSNCEQLETLDCSNNYLTQIIYPTNLEKLTKLEINNNNLPTSDLTIF